MALEYQTLALDTIATKVNRLLTLNTNDLGSLVDKYNIAVHGKNAAEDQFTVTMDKIFSKSVNYNLSQMHFICRRYSPKDMVKWIENKVNIKIESLRVIIKNHLKLNINMYLQIWSEFETFCCDLNQLFEKCFSYLSINLASKNEKHKNTLVTVIQRITFYKKLIVEENLFEKLFVEDYCSDNYIDHNILSKFTATVKDIMSLEFYTSGIDKVYLLNLLKKTIDKIDIVEQLCRDQHMVISTEPVDSTTFSEICKILHLSQEKKRISVLYTKYLQTRLTAFVTNPSSENAFLLQMQHNLDPVFFTKAKVIISDAVEAKNLHIKLSNVRIKNVSGRKKYEVDLSVLYPTIMTKHKWMIPQLVDLNLTYTPEFDYVLSVIQKTFTATQLAKEQIKWLPYMGSVTFSVCFGHDEETLLKCNMLQAIVLSAFNEKARYHFHELVSDLDLDRELLSKILTSVVNAKILTCVDDVFTINFGADLMGIVDVKAYFDVILFGQTEIRYLYTESAPIINV
jgi:hypothetical protein